MMRRIVASFSLFLGFAQGMAQQPQLPDNIQTANCAFTPESTEWGIVEKWSSSVNVSTLVIPMVGDINGDGIPEIVCFAPSGSDYYNVNTVLVFDTQTHAVTHTFTLPGDVSTVDASPYGLVKLHNGHVMFAVCCKNSSMYGYDLTNQGTTPMWTASIDQTAPNIGFADFNGDGYPEIYVARRIFDAETGTMLINGSSISNIAGSYAHYSSYKLSSPFVTNILGDNHPELILGNEIYSVTITNRTGLTGNTITLAQSCTPPSGISVDGHPQVADFNMDGYLDVFISNKPSSSSNNVGCYVWDVHNNTVSQPLLIPTTGGGKSIPMIADIDGDNMLEMVIQCQVSGNKVRAYRYNPTSQSFTMIWDLAVDEDSYSNGATTFDFNHDNEMEVLMSDQSTIKILNGATGSTITQLSFGECTVMQYPVIADVDADGNAEIAICGRFGSGHTNSGNLLVFCSSGAPWAPARKVWNQYMYNVTNVNQDLSIPAYIYNNATPFTDPQNVTRRPFNNFLQQATTLDQYGRPFYGAPDVEAISATVENHGSYAQLDVTYTNQGDAVLNAPYSITVFANQLGGTVLNTTTVNAPLRQGQTTTQSIQISMTTLCHTQNLNSLVVAVNCAGGGIGQNGNQQAECDITNNTAEVAMSLIIEPTYLYEEACDEFVWFGQTYTQSGQYTHQMQNAYGCDSTIYLNLTINHSATTNLYVETCDNYYWYGQTYNQSGTYNYHLQTIDGCDSLLILHLTIGEAFSQEYSVEACDLYHWRGQDYTQSGTYTETVEMPDGCDSIFILHLTINESATTYLEATACDQYEWQGQTYYESGTYEYLTQTVAGCDSLLILNLTLGESYAVDTIANVCQYFTWHGQTYYESGDYELLFHTAIGCDSLVTLHLTLGDVSVIEEEITACNSYTWRGHTYFQGGQYSETIENPDGCDTIYRLDLHLGFDTTGDTIAMTCEPFTWYGQTYTQTGDYQHLLYTPYGCDSLVTLHFTIGDAMLHPAEVEETCDESFTWRGHTYTQSGVYYDTVAGIAGCDDIYQLDLTLSEAVTVQIEDTACDRYEWPWAPDGYLTESGHYSQTLQSEAGCDSIVNLNLTVYQTPDMTINGLTQVAVQTNLTSGTYYYNIPDSLNLEPNTVEWVCSNENWVVTPLGNGYRCRLIVPTIGEGVLKAIAHNSTGCDSSFGLEILATYYDVDENEALGVKLFPNPAQSQVTIEAAEIQQVRLVDAIGQTLMNKEFEQTDAVILDLGHLPSGVYAVEITTRLGSATKRLIIKR